MHGAAFLWVVVAGSLAAASPFTAADAHRDDVMVFGTRTVAEDAVPAPVVAARDDDPTPTPTRTCNRGYESPLPANGNFNTSQLAPWQLCGSVNGRVVRTSATGTASPSNCNDRDGPYREDFCVKTSSNNFYRGSNFTIEQRLRNVCYGKNLACDFDFYFQDTYNVTDATSPASVGVYVYLNKTLVYSSAWRSGIEPNNWKVGYFGITPGSADGDVLRVDMTSPQSKSKGSNVGGFSRIGCFMTR